MNSTQDQSNAPVAAPASFTPGPWHIESDTDIVSELGMWICQTHAEGSAIGTAQEYANARLIAAAPELLAALETMVERLAIASTDDHAESCKQFYEYSTIVVEARAALAKAKGQ